MNGGYCYIRAAQMLPNFLLEMYIFISLQQGLHGLFQCTFMRAEKMPGLPACWQNHLCFSVTGQTKMYTNSLQIIFWWD